MLSCDLQLVNNVVSYTPNTINKILTTKYREFLSEFVMLSIVSTRYRLGWVKYVNVMEFFTLSKSSTKNEKLQLHVLICDLYICHMLWSLYLWSACDKYKDHTYLVMTNANVRSCQHLNLIQSSSLWPILCILSRQSKCILFL